MVFGDWGSAAEELAQEAALAWLGGVPRALLRLRDTTHDLIDMLAAPGPRRFATLLAGD